MTSRPLDEIRPHPANPKTHDLDLIADSIVRFGFVDPVVIDTRTGLLVSGHGRTEALKRLRDTGAEPPDGITDSWDVPTYEGWGSDDDAEAEAALVALNRTTEAGGWDDQALVDILERLEEVEGGMVGVGYDTEDVAVLRDRLADPVAPIEFEAPDLATDQECPSCGYRWSS